MTSTPPSTPPPAVSDPNACSPTAIDTGRPLARPEPGRPLLERARLLAATLRDLSFAFVAIGLLYSLITGLPALALPGEWPREAAGGGIAAMEVWAEGTDDGMTKAGSREHALKDELKPRALRACMDAIDPGAFKRSQHLECIRAEQARLLAILDREIRRQDPAMVAALQAAERSLASVRDRWCALESARDPTPTAAVSELTCSAERTRDFVALLARHAR